MERVTFLIEDSGEQLSCMLNPERVVLRRSSGLVRQRSLGAELDGATDDLVLRTGGGSTEVELDLLFDLSLGPLDAVARAEDVRELTGALWRLTERGESGCRAATARLIWGRCWNMRVVVDAIAERLEEFSPVGAARRSWLRVRLLRIEEEAPRSLEDVQDELPSVDGDAALGAALDELAADDPGLPGEGNVEVVGVEVLQERAALDSGLWELVAGLQRDAEGDAAMEEAEGAELTPQGDAGDEGAGDLGVEATGVEATGVDATGVDAIGVASIEDGAAIAAASEDAVGEDASDAEVAADEGLSEASDDARAEGPADAAASTTVTETAERGLAEPAPAAPAAPATREEPASAPNASVDIAMTLRFAEPRAIATCVLVVMGQAYAEEGRLAPASRPVSTPRAPRSAASTPQRAADDRVASPAAVPAAASGAPTAARAAPAAAMPAEPARARVAPAASMPAPSATPGAPRQGAPAPAAARTIAPAAVVAAPAPPPDAAAPAPPAGAPAAARRRPTAPVTPAPAPAPGAAESARTAPSPKVAREPTSAPAVGAAAGPCNAHPRFDSGPVRRRVIASERELWDGLRRYADELERLAVDSVENARLALQRALRAAQRLGTDDLSVLETWVSALCAAEDATTFEPPRGELDGLRHDVARLWTQGERERARRLAACLTQLDRCEQQMRAALRALDEEPTLVLWRDTCHALSAPPGVSQAAPALPVALETRPLVAIYKLTRLDGELPHALRALLQVLLDTEASPEAQRSARAAAWELSRREYERRLRLRRRSVFDPRTLDAARLRTRRLDLVAQQRFGNPGAWRRLARAPAATESEPA